MKIITNNIKWIMLVSGVLTATMISITISPQSALLMSFGETLNTPLGEMVARSWGFLIFLMGVMLIYGAYKPAYRNFILSIVGSSKVFFIALVIAYGYAQPALLSICVDTLMVLLYVLYLLASKDAVQTEAAQN